MTEIEKRELVNWLAERLETEPEYHSIGYLQPCRVRSTLGLWEIFLEGGEKKAIHAAPLDGNFSSAVMEFLRKEGVNFGIEYHAENKEYFAWVDGHEGNNCFHDKDPDLAFCIAAKKALQNKWQSTK
jgi:hypothetical protein